MAAGAAILASAVAQPASAINITLTPIDDSFATQANGAAAFLAFEKAANYWNRTLVGDTAINIGISFAPLGDGVLGQAGSNSGIVRVSDVYAALGSHAATNLDRIAVANLQTLNGDGTLNFRANAPLTGLGGANSEATFYDANGTDNNRYLDVNSAQIKALGLTAINYDANAYDAQISFSSAFDFDFDPTDGVSAGAYDFTGVAVHELGHALGFVSGVDTYDYVASLGAAGTRFELDDYAIGSILDLYRYGNGFNEADGSRSLQWAANRDAFFSIDGQTPYNYNQAASAELASFSTGAFTGDGSQASHWADAKAFVQDPAGACYFDARQIGIMDPTASPCGNGIVTSNDLAAMDAIGWNLSKDILTDPGYTMNTAQIFALPLTSAVPEAATWAYMMMGIGLGGLGLRRRAARSVKASISFA
jgi:hypothetical protein